IRSNGLLQRSNEKSLAPIATVRFFVVVSARAQRLECDVPIDTGYCEWREDHDKKSNCCDRSEAFLVRTLQQTI
ncbi:MAG: hypothetical protein AAF742_01615, partial [Pseudomonadota bacterium]